MLTAKTNGAVGKTDGTAIFSLERSTFAKHIFLAEMGVKNLTPFSVSLLLYTTSS